MTVDFLPAVATSRSIASEFKAALQTCQSVTGCVAFWTLAPDAFGGALVSALSKPGSSVCVDFQKPTDFEKLTAWHHQLSFARPDPVVHLCVRQSTTLRSEQDSIGLLHTKIWLFDLGDGQYDVWVGSHNATRSAMEGFNLEGTVRVSGHASEPEFLPLLERVGVYLSYIREQCRPFNPNDVVLYQSLRGEVNETLLNTLLRETLFGKRIAIESILIGRVLSFQGDNVGNLAGQTLILLGNLTRELSYIRSLNRGGSAVYVRILERGTQVQHHYEGRIRPSDFIDNEFSKNVAFNQRRWAVRRASRVGQATEPPVLNDVRDVNRQLIHGNRYYLNVELTRHLAVEGQEVWYYSYPETDPSRLWRTVLPEERYRPLEDFGFPVSNVYGSELHPFQIPVVNAEELVRLRPVPWSQVVADQLLERRFVVIGRATDEQRT